MRSSSSSRFTLQLTAFDNKRVCDLVFTFRITITARVISPNYVFSVQLIKILIILRFTFSLTFSSYFASNSAKCESIWKLIRHIHTIHAFLQGTDDRVSKFSVCKRRSFQNSLFNIILLDKIIQCIVTQRDRM